MNGPIPRPHHDGLPPTVHLSGNFRGTEGSLYGYGKSQADPPVVRAGVQVCLQITGQVQVHAAIAGVDVPWRSHPRAAIHVGGHAAVAGLDIQRVKAALDIYVPVARGKIRAAVQVAAFNMSVTRVQADVSFGPLYRDVPVARAHI